MTEKSSDASLPSAMVGAGSVSKVIAALSSGPSKFMTM